MPAIEMNTEDRHTDASNPHHEGKSEELFSADIKEGHHEYHHIRDHYHRDPKHELAVEVVGELDQNTAVDIAYKAADALVADGVDLKDHILVVDANTNEVFPKKFVEVIGDMDYKVATEIAYKAAAELSKAGEDLSRKVIVVNANTDEVYSKPIEPTHVSRH